VWPESSTPVLLQPRLGIAPSDSATGRRNPHAVHHRHRTNSLCRLPPALRSESTTVGWLLGADGRSSDTKDLLAPFGEYVPFQRLRLCRPLVDAVPNSPGTEGHGARHRRGRISTKSLASRVRAVAAFVKKRKQLLRLHERCLVRHSRSAQRLRPRAMRAVERGPVRSSGGEYGHSGVVESYGRV